METVTTEELDRLLAAMIQSVEGISDLLFVAGKPPQMEVHGRLKPFAPDPAESALTSARIEGLAGAIINGNPRLLQDLAEHGSCDCSYSLKNFCRFRVNIYRQNGNYAMVLRQLQSLVPSLDSLHLPPVFRDVIREKNGLVFVTGGTGSGKTTTLAAMLNEINQTGEVRTSSPRSASASWGAISTISPTACAPPCARRPRSSSSAKSATATRWRSP